jgi:hypothetical protein
MSRERIAFAQELVDGCIQVLPALTGIDLYTYQNEMADRIFFSLIYGDSEEITIEATRQGGKALSVDVPILTTNGWRTMGTLAVGDRVFAPDGTDTLVIEKSLVFTEHDCYRLHFSDGQTLVADAGHRWVFRDTEIGKIITITTEQLVGNTHWSRYGEPQCRYRYDMAEPYKATERDLPLDPYVLGSWLGDGTSSRAEVTSADEEIIDRIVGAGFPRSYTYDSQHNGRAKMYGFKGLHRPLRELGLLSGRYSGTKHVPEVYFISSPTQRLELLRGLMDTDGSVNERGNTEISLSDKRLARDTLRLVRSLGMKATMVPRATTHKTSYRIRFHPYQEMNPFTLPHKAARVTAPPLEPWRRRKTESNALVAVERVPTVDTQCISVDHSSHLYLAGDGFIPTHNSEALADIVATAMIIIPKIAAMYPEDPVLKKFLGGIEIGIFGPIDEQADTIFGRIEDRLTSPVAKSFLADPEIDDWVHKSGNELTTRSGSLCRRQTAHAKAKIESKTYHLIVLDEAQDADTTKVRKSLHPMLTAVAGSIIKVGTPAPYKSDYYEAIMRNKRRGPTHGKRNHFAYDWRRAARENPYYKLSIQKEKERLGEDSDEFQMCVAPNTQVLTADLRYILASDVEEGMKLVGFDEHRPGKGLHRQLHTSTVEAVSIIMRPTYRLAMDDGTTIDCSAEHLWLVKTAGSRTIWKTTEDLVESDRIFKITDVWEQRSTHMTGYLAGIFDGEGHLSNPHLGMWQLGMCQKEGVVLDRTKEYLDKLGYTYWCATENIGTNGDVVRLMISGGRAAIMRFLGQIRPQRLLDKLDIDQLGSIGRHDHKGQDFRHPTIMTKTFLGSRKVVAFRTSTRTFIAEGLASHNSYNLKWMLDRGMFITEEQLDELGDKTMQTWPYYTDSPIVIGIDVARKHDSTVATAVWVDWEHPDEFGLYRHQILNWLELHGENWEAQYRQICDFAAQYYVLRIGVDGQGMGGPVAERLQVLMPNIEVVEMAMNPIDQSERWTHLMQLIQRGLIGWPAHARTRRTLQWKRFIQQMSDVEKTYKGKYLLVGAPENEKNAHDDYIDSLALACSMTKEFGQELEVTVWNNNPLLERGMRAM